MAVENKKLVAVTGATGRLGRRVVVNLSKQGVPTRCLVRRDIPEDTKPDESNLNGGSSVEVAAYLRSLPNVELVVGDVTNQDSIDKLMTGCTSVLSLHGPVQGSVWKSLIPLIGTREDDAAHSKMINYVSLQYMIEAAKSWYLQSDCENHRKGRRSIWHLFNTHQHVGNYGQGLEL